MFVRVCVGVCVRVCVRAHGFKTVRIYQGGIC